ncbi:hypothetical protein LINGRAHAP2_LOCUS15173 [Linum grandiflorum]
MKLLSGQSKKRNQLLLRLGKKIVRSATGSSSSSSVAIVVGTGRKKKISLMGYVPKNLIYKFKSQWKQAAIGFQNNGRSHNLNYNYDIHSYSLNFDDGLCQ